MINYYESLGLEPNASEEDIKNAYRQLAKRHHPDVMGGDPVLFSRISEAYEVLSDAGRRRNFDRMLKARERQRQAQPDPLVRPRPAAREAGLGPPFTRLMSLAMPRNGRFLLEGLAGEFVVSPNAPADIWETTVAKFGGEPAAVLAGNVVQIRLTGPREVVKRLRPIPTDFGIQLQGAGKDQFQSGALGDSPSASAFLNAGMGAFEPLLEAPVKMTVTLPPGVPLYLYDLSGKIRVGDLAGELVATLDQQTVLRAGQVAAADLTLNGHSKAYLAGLQGSADVMAFGQSKLLLDGKVSRLRVVIEHEAHVEVLAPVEGLQADVRGRGYLNVKGPVDNCHYDVRAGAYIRLAQVRGGISGSRSGAAGIDILEGPPRQSGSGQGPQTRPGFSQFGNSEPSHQGFSGIGDPAGTRPGASGFGQGSRESARPGAWFTGSRRP